MMRTALVVLAFFLVTPRASRFKISKIESGEKLAETSEDELAKTDNDLAEAEEEKADAASRTTEEDDDTWRITDGRTGDEGMLKASGLEEGGASPETRAWTMQRLAAVVYITVETRRSDTPITNITDSDIQNLDEEQTQAMLHLIGTILDKANDGTPAGNDVKAILNKIKQKVQNTGYGRNPKLCALAKVRNGATVPYCKLTAYQLLTVVRVSDRCAATTTKDLLHFVQAYYKLGNFQKKYKAVIDDRKFHGAAQDLKREAVDKTKLTGGGLCGPNEEEGICVHIVCPEGLIRGGYGKAENDAFNRQCQERAPANQRVDWFCCYKPDTTASDLKSDQARVDRLLRNQ